jgi:beta-glucosidase
MGLSARLHAGVDAWFCPIGRPTPNVPCIDARPIDEKARAAVATGAMHFLQRRNCCRQPQARAAKLPGDQDRKPTSARQCSHELGWVAALMAVREILEVRPDAIFIQSESSEYFHAEAPSAICPAEIMNSQRFLSLDLNYGRSIDSEMYDYLMDNGMMREEYHFFLDNRLKQHCIMGNDYYVTNEHGVSVDGTTRASGEIFGYSEITRQYHQRYYLPVMHTETNLSQGPLGTEAVDRLWKQWANVLRVRNDGVPIAGFTWYSLTDQMDWDSALREKRGNVNPLGLYDLVRNIRPVGEAYKRLIQQWRDVLPTQSLCLTVPVVLPSDAGRSFAA